MSPLYSPPAPDRAAVDPEELGAFDRIVDRTTAMTDRDGFASAPERGAGNPFVSSMLNSPIMGYHYFELGVYYRTRGEFDGGFDHAEREWVDMVLAQDLRCWTILWAHLPDAIAVGCRPEAVKALRQGRERDLTPEELQLTDFIRRVHRGEVTADSYRAIERRFGVRGTVDYVGFIGHVLMSITWYRAFGADVRPEADVDELLAQISEGSYQLPHPKARVPLPESVASFELRPIGRREL